METEGRQKGDRREKGDTEMEGREREKERESERETDTHLCTSISLSRCSNKNSAESELRITSAPKGLGTCKQD